MGEMTKEDIENYRIEPRAYPREVVTEVCDLALRALSAEPAKPIGEMRESGVYWHGKNPHAFPVGTKFYASADPHPSERRVGQEIPLRWVDIHGNKSSADRRKPTEQYERQLANDDAAFLASLAPLPTERPALQTGVWDCEVTIGRQPMIDLSKPTERTAGTCIAFPNCSEAECTIPAVCSGQAQCAKPRATERAAQQESSESARTAPEASGISSPAVAARPQEELAERLEILAGGFEASGSAENAELLRKAINVIAAPQEAAPKDALFERLRRFRNAHTGELDDAYRLLSEAMYAVGRAAPQAPREAQAVAQAKRSLSRLCEYSMQHAKGNTGLRESIKCDSEVIEDALARPAPEGWVSVPRDLFIRGVEFIQFALDIPTQERSAQETIDDLMALLPATPEPR